jgi:hypothetical protein
MSGSTLRLLFVAPYPLDVPGGNSTAIRRLARHLAEHLHATGKRFEPLVAT